MMAIDTIDFGDGVEASGGRHFLFKLSTYIWEHLQTDSELRRVLDKREGWSAVGWFPFDKLEPKEYVELDRLLAEYEACYQELNGDLLKVIQEDELARLKGVRECVAEKLRRMREQAGEAGGRSAGV